MAPSPYYPDPSHDTTYGSFPNSRQPELKASYDDFVEDYNAPYVPSNHKTFNTDADSLAGDHRHDPPKPFSHHSSSLFTKHSEDFDSTHSAYPPRPPIQDEEKRSFWRKILPDSLACRLYILTVLIETTVDLAIEAELLVRVNRVNDQSREMGVTTTDKMPVYLSIFALAHVFQFVMAVDAVYARNTLQFIFLAIFNALFLVYAIIQIREVQEALSFDSSVPGFSEIPIKVLTTIIPIVISIAQLLYVGLGWKIYNEFGWKLYKTLGADRRIKKMFANYQIYQCLIKFDVFFWLGFSVQFIWLVLKRSTEEYYITYAALPLSLVLLVEGHLAARHENKWMMATFLSGCVGAMVYFIYKLVKVLMFKELPQFKPVWKSLTIFSIIAILLLLATFVFAVSVMRNFGRGLKTSMARRNAKKHGQFASHGQHHRAASANPNRMSID